jgi:hydroxymethylglutaryl-CoA lyase
MQIQLTECPRDAMQGMHDFVPTELKIRYINSILECGFDTVDFGSFVSPKAIPQMRDTAEVLAGLQPSTSKLLAIVANERGAEDAAQFERIDYLGYPFSVSEEFQRRNTNASIEESLGRVEVIRTIAEKANKELVVYLSMAFGNPYGETWHPDKVIAWSERLYKEFDIRRLTPSDTIGSASPDIVASLFNTLIPGIPQAEFGAHLHTLPHKVEDLLDAAYSAGCTRFDGAIKGFGGCPMAKDDLTGNMPTEGILAWADAHKIATGIDTEAFGRSMQRSGEVFP